MNVIILIFKYGQQRWLLNGSILSPLQLLSCLQHGIVQALSRLFKADVIQPPQQQLESPQGTSAWYVFKLTGNKGRSAVENNPNGDQQPA